MAVSDITYKIITYNLHGLNQGLTYLKDLLEVHDIVFVQEHWLDSTEFVKLSEINKDFTVVAVSSMEDKLAAGILRGRPFGGLAIFIRNRLISRLSIVSRHTNYIIIKFNDLLLINVYMPCNNVLLYENMLGEISHNIQTEKCNVKYTVMGGDYNADYYASQPMYLCRILNNFADENNLKCTVPYCAWNGVEPYTYCHNYSNGKSFIDYFMISENVIGSIYNHCIMDSGLNLSDHIPVRIDICLKLDQTACGDNQNSTTSNNKDDFYSLRWDKAHLPTYYEYTRQYFQPIYDSLNNDIVVTNCLQMYGNVYMNTLYNDIINAFNYAALVIPRVKSSTFKFWWNETLNLLKEKSIESFRLWDAAGKPRNGDLFQKMTKAKLEYKSAIRKYEKQSKNVFSDKLNSALASKNTKTFWKSWNGKFKKKQSKPVMVEGHTDSTAIANKFKSYFGNTCVPNNQNVHDKHKDEFLRLYENYNGDENMNSNSSFEIENVEQSVQKLKMGKAAGEDNVMAEHIKYAHPIVLSCLCKFFNLVMRCEQVPDAFGRGTMVPVPKDNNADLSLCENYRCITLSCVLSKLFEYMLLNKYSSYLSTDNLQFGFKPNVGCSDAIFCLKSVVNHFVRNGSTITLTTLDISKAFDKVSHYALFTELIKRNVPKIFVNILISWYSKCVISVKFNGILSSHFRMEAGVKQGGILSPVLFTVYINVLLSKLKSSGLGCSIYGAYFGCFMYADDIVLLSQSVTTMQKMLNLCCKIANLLDFKFNVRKTAVIRIGSRFKEKCGTLTLYNENVRYVESIKYLGIFIKSAKTFECCYDNAKSKFYRSFNSIYSKSKAANSELVSVHLMKVYCLPILLYATEAVNPKNAIVNKFNKIIFGSIGKIFNTYDIQLIEDILCNLRFNLSDQLESRRASFWYKWCKNDLSFRDVVLTINKELTM